MLFCPPPLWKTGAAPMLVTNLGVFTGSRSSNNITYSGLPDTSAYPEVLALPSWRRDSDGSRAMGSITFGGNAGLIMAQDNNSSRQAAGGGICRYAGAWTGDIVITMGGSTANDHRMTLVGLSKAITNVVQASSTTGNASSIPVSPSSPGALGVRVALLASNGSGATITWANAIEMSDESTGNHLQSSAYDLGDDATDMNPIPSGTINYAAIFVSIN